MYITVYSTQSTRFIVQIVEYTDFLLNMLYIVHYDKYMIYNVHVQVS